MMYRPFRASLRAIYEEFKRASASFPGLYHEQVFDAVQNDTLISCDALRAMEQSQVDFAGGPIWQFWHGPHAGGGDSAGLSTGGSWYGRFHGNEAVFEEFGSLAESAYLVLAEMEEGPISRLEEKEYRSAGFLGVMYKLAVEYPTPLLRVEEKMLYWHSGGWTEHLEEVSAGCSAEPTPPWTGVRSLSTNVFTAAMAAIRMVLRPHETLLVKEASHSEYRRSLALLIPTAERETTPGTTTPTSDGGKRPSPDTVDQSPAADESAKTAEGGDRPTDPHAEGPAALPEGSAPTRTDEAVPSAKPQAGPQAQVNSFRKQGDGWFIEFVDITPPEQAWFPNSVPLNHYHKLLRMPGQWIDCIDLHSPSTPETRAGEGFARDDKADAIAIAAYRCEIRKLTDREASARGSGKGDKAAEYADERLAVEKHLKQAIGIFNRRRLLGAPPATEQARKTVAQALRRCRIKLASKMPQFGSFLDHSTELNGSQVRYKPPTNIVWNT